VSESVASARHGSVPASKNGAERASPVAMKRTVWFVSQVFGRQENSTGYLLSQLAEALGVDHRIAVITPHDGLKPVRGGRSLPLRRAGQAVADASMLGWRAMRRVRRGDIVIALTNPPLLPAILAPITALRGARLIVLVHDVYPEALYASRWSSGYSIAARIFDRLNTRALRTAHAVIAIGRDMQRLLSSKLLTAPDHIDYIPNWADPEISAGEPPIDGPRQPDRPFIVQYSGKMGATHNPELLAATAELLSTRKDQVQLQVFAWGSGLDLLKGTIRRRKLTNVEIRDPCARARLAGQLASCDVGLILMRPGMAGVSVPCRLYNLMAAGKPVIVAAEAETEVAATVRETGIGWVVEPDNPESLAEAISEAASDPARLVEMGRRARRAAHDDYSLVHAVERYRQVLSRVDSIRD
jgi:colanic acid biosynthesis glycosyl transferase WcaI